MAVTNLQKTSQESAVTEKRPTLSIKRKPTNPITKAQLKAESKAAFKTVTDSKPPKALKLRKQHHRQNGFR